MSAPDMPGLEPSEAPEVPQATTTPTGPENAPEGLDDGAMGGPSAWAAAVAAFYGQGPEAPKPSTSTYQINDVMGDLARHGWAVRPCPTGGYFGWCQDRTEFCHDVADLRALSKKVTAEHYARAKRAKLDRMAEEYRASKAAASEPKPSAAESKNAARQRRVEMKNAFFTALGRVLARVTARRDVDVVGQQGEN